MKEREELPENTISVDLETGYTQEGRLNLSQENIRAFAKVLTRVLLDYARAGRDMPESDITEER